MKLPPTETISRCYQPQQSNRKVIRILTVAVYVLCVSLAAIMLSLYYIFIWDPTIRPFVTKANQCGKSQRAHLALSPPLTPTPSLSPSSCTCPILRPFFFQFFGVALARNISGCETNQLAVGGSMLSLSFSLSSLPLFLSLSLLLLCAI